ncbi:MAG TPA: hypothetical protein VFH38_10065 [Jatrophihabitans sp.]|nr:hypothetical protein [Jatrophihabitans sp.]
MGAPGPVDVHGGAGGITAACDEIVALARAFGGVATDCLGAAWSLHGYLVDPALACSGLLDPGGYAVFEADLLDALDGLHGLTWLGMRCGVLDGELRVAATAYSTADHLYEKAHDEVLGLLGAPAALADAAARLAHTASPIAAAQTAITDDPEAADTVIHALGLPGAIYALAAALPDGHGVATSLGVDAGGSAALPPRRLSDVIGELGHRDEDPHHGAIDVRVLTLADGSRRVIVDVTGTKSWTPAPTADVTSLTTNGRALVGIPTAYEQGVFAAMRQAGVRRTDPVMIVGHSQGGMVAVEAARDAAASGEFTISHVVTAGSPIGLTVGALPRRVQVLALENERDLVPHLDGVANPDEPNITTVCAAHGDGTVVGDHDIEADYVPLARDAQASGSISVRAFLHSARDFFRGVAVRTHAYQVTRAY